MLFHSAPLIRVKVKDLGAAGIERVTRVVGVRNGKPELTDGRTLAVRNVIWCTGFNPGFDWIDLPIFSTDGGSGSGRVMPEHEKGMVTQIPGMYFVGLHYLYAMSSATVVGVGRDAERIVKAIESRNGVGKAA
jgi:putative flavoprotein involved in K+ transport